MAQNPLIPADEADEAVNMIRHKITDLYDHEPSAKAEIAEVSQNEVHLSKHQRYMQALSTSGKSLAEIQTAWHMYYQSLPDAEKHEVWQEFYAAHENNRHGSQPAAIAYEHAPKNKHHEAVKPQTHAQLEAHVIRRNHRRRQRKHHLQSLAFGLGMGLLVVLILMFSFFNERFIAPFITPSRNVSANPIIIDPNTTAVGKDPMIIIPKINVEAPVIYDEPSVDEHAVQAALDRGVLHYATTPNPGEKGNGAIFGHSSNNILNKGKYKFAFVLLKALEPGDTFMLQKDGKRYVYKVFSKRIVPPTEVSVLNPYPDKPATFTLITCDPPGMSTNRLIVAAEQVTPDPNLNLASTAKQYSNQPAILPSNSESLWHRLTSWL